MGSAIWRSKRKNPRLWAGEFRVRRGGRIPSGRSVAPSESGNPWISRSRYAAQPHRQQFALWFFPNFHQCPLKVRDSWERFFWVRPLALISDGIDFGGRSGASRCCRTACSLHWFMAVVSCGGAAMSGQTPFCSIYGFPAVGHIRADCAPFSLEPSRSDLTVCRTVSRQDMRADQLPGERARHRELYGHSVTRPSAPKGQRTISAHIFGAGGPNRGTARRPRQAPRQHGRAQRPSRRDRPRLRGPGDQRPPALSHRTPRTRGTREIIL